MTVFERVIEAPNLDAARSLARRLTPEDRKALVDQLASEVLRLTRTDARRALDVAERTVAVADEDEDRGVRARAIWVRGHGLGEVMRNREAAECYEHAAAEYRALGETLSEARVFVGWMATLFFLGEYKKALSLGERARRVFMRHGLAGEAARLDSNMGNIHHQLEGPAKALRHFDRALKVATRHRDPLTRIIQLNRAHCLKAIGRLETAEKVYRDVKDEAQAAGETRHAALAEGALGHLELLRGEYGRAYASLDAARTMFEELADPHLLTQALTDLAELLLEMSAFRRARDFGRRARAVAERHQIQPEAGRAALYQGLACLGLGELSAAATHLEDAARRFRRIGNPVSWSICSLYLAELEVRRGKLSRAARMLERSVVVFAEEGLILREATAQVRRAAVDLERGRHEQVREAILRTRSLLRRLRSPWLLAQANHLAGRLAMLDGKLGLAVRYFRRAVQGVESIHGRIGIDEFRISYGEDRAPIYADLVHALLQRGGPRAAADAFEIVERSRSRALVDLLAGRLTGAHEAADPAVVSLVKRLEKLRADLNWRSGFDVEDQKERRDETRLVRFAAEARDLEEKIADAIRRLQGREATVGALTAGEAVTHGEVRRAVPADSVLVEYYLSRYGTIAFVVSRDDTRLVDLRISRSELAEMTRRLRFQMEKWGYGDEYIDPRRAALRATLDHQLRLFGERLWNPLEVSARRVVVVPHGPLHSLPFHAITGADGRPLIDRHVFSYLPSASVRRYLGEDDLPPVSGRNPDEVRVLAVGVGDSSIPLAEHEAERVRRLFRHGCLLRGPRATRQRFFHEATKADVVHVATHGLFREDDPHFSSLRLADGWMSLYDLYGMRLRAGLVCVSACQSGRSWIGAGDEVVGLVRGFLHAGAKTLVMSLWPVRDKSTARLMQSFYRHLHSDKSSEEALHEAVHELREEFPHPYHWAPFVLIGRGGKIRLEDPQSRS
jgi:CHAT domain-containing protein/tetratricopeptide (TPR) repeat protein